MAFQVELFVGSPALCPAPLNGLVIVAQVARMAGDDCLAPSATGNRTIPGNGAIHQDLINGTATIRDVYGINRSVSLNCLGSGTLKKGAGIRLRIVSFYAGAGCEHWLTYPYSLLINPCANP